MSIAAACTGPGEWLRLAAGRTSAAGLLQAFSATFTPVGDIEERHPGELARREEQKYEWRFPAGECYSDADLRAGRALRQIECDGAARPLLVTHEMLARTMIR